MAAQSHSEFFHQFTITYQLLLVFPEVIIKKLSKDVFICIWLLVSP